MGSQFIVGIVFGFMEWLFPGSVLPQSWRDNAKKNKRTS